MKLTTTRPTGLLARIGIVAALFVTSIVATLSFGVSPAAASATGCSWWGPHTVGGITLQTGEECASVNGSGTWVNNTSVSFNSPWSNVCNWREVDRFRDTNGTLYATIYGPTHYGCWHANWDQVNINGNARSGSVQIALQQNGADITSVTHSIHP